jgi:hypothetical protein
MKIYVATKLHHAAKFRELRPTWEAKGLTIVSRWLDMEHVETNNSDVITRDDYAIFWRVDEADVKASDVVLVYSQYKTDELRGALVEAGMGIAFGKPIVLVGDNPAYGSWQYHPSVVHATTLDHARFMIENLYMEYRT